MLELSQAIVLVSTNISSASMERDWVTLHKELAGRVLELTTEMGFSKIKNVILMRVYWSQGN